MLDAMRLFGLGVGNTTSLPGLIAQQEFPKQHFARVISLPVDIDPDKVEARFNSGVLTITMPKSEAAKPRKITVKTE